MKLAPHCFQYNANFKPGNHFILFGCLFWLLCYSLFHFNGNSSALAACLTWRFSPTAKHYWKPNIMNFQRFSIYVTFSDFTALLPLQFMYHHATCNDKRNSFHYYCARRDNGRYRRNIEEAKNRRRIIYPLLLLKLSLNLFNIPLKYRAKIGLLLLCINAIFIHFAQQELKL